MRLVFVHRPYEQERVPPDHGDTAGLEALCKLNRGIVVGQLDPDLPRRAAALQRLGSLASLLPLVLGLDLLVGAWQRHGGVLPGLLDWMPTLER